MCGITGVYNFKKDGKLKFNQHQLQAMTDALFHRGPDDSGYYIEDENLFLGFRRLSIIDLANGQQPNFNEDNSIVSVCNGEIFNYKELRHELMQKGHKFRSSCDVEVLVHLYEEYGIDFIKKLNGQFAFIIYDKNLRKAIIARDHVGICPLFFSVKGDSIIFGSEIKSILQYPEISREVNLEGLDQVFCLPGLASPTTMFKDINALKPGHCIIIENEQINLKEYWDLNFKEVEKEEEHPDKYYIEQLHDLLFQSVKYRLNSDVPLGLFISGGLDSSIIAGITKSLEPDMVRESFAIAFNNKNYDESRYQQIVSKYANTTHHEITFNLDDISERLRHAIYYAEAPLKETYNTCSLALSEFVRSRNIKVVLTGEGADEVFAGYVGHKLDKQRKMLNSDLADWEKELEYEIRDNVWGDKNFQYERNLYPYQEVRQAIYSDGINDSFYDFNCLNERLLDKSKIHNLSNIKKRTYIDFKLRLSDHLLADHGDRVAYANSIEARYPFLDINVIEFARKIPDRLKVKDLCEKYILRETFGDYLPPEIKNREKFGFVAPGTRFLLQQNIEWVNDMLSYESIKKQGYFNADTIERLKNQYKSPDFVLSETFEVDLLMIVLTFQLFKDLFKMPNLN